MRFDIEYKSTYGDSGWDIKINEEIVNKNLWSKEKIIKVITTIIEVIEE